MSNIKSTLEFIKNKQKQKEYNDEIVNKTLHYKNKFGFKTNSQKGHEFWNNEADAFKHAFIGADMYLRQNNQYSLWGGMYHEYQTPNNPPREWNMDSWNNNQGREIAKEIKKEYGDKFTQLSQQQQNDIIAVKIMYKMRNGELITNPTDARDYKGKIENYMNNHPEIFNHLEKTFGVNQTTGYAANINTNQPAQHSNLSNYTNPLTGNNRIYTREDIASMTNEEFAQHEKEIDAQTRAFNGTMPTNSDLQQEALVGGGVVHVESYTRSDGTKVKSYYRSRPNF